MSGQLHNDHDYGQLMIPPEFFDDNTSTLDPSLFALAAQVQAVAHAQAQGIDINFNIDPTFIDPIFPLPLDDQGGIIGNVNLDQHLSNNGLGGGTAPMIDPSLFEIAQVVEDVNKGKIKLENQPNPIPLSSNSQIHGNLPNQNITLQHQQALELGSNGQNQNAQHPQHQGQEGSADGIQLDHEIDPTLREIVNSLTNAQQSSHVNGQGLSHIQAAAALGAHLTDAEERERLQQSLQTTLEDMSQGNFGNLFPPNFPQSPSSNFINLTSGDGVTNDPSQAGTSTRQSKSREEFGSKRGRGRPKGSKNKHKATPTPRPKLPKPPGPPSKPKGRPPKERNPEEQADYELRKHERSLGILRSKGRPRKFPGYLVREMRLKKNRKEYNVLLKNHRDNEDDDDDDSDDDEEEQDHAEDNQDLQQNPNQQQQQQYLHNNLEGIEKVQEEMRIIMDVENMTNGLHHNLQVNNHDQNQHIHVNGNEHHQQQHQHDDNENDFGNWSVQDGQTLLDVVGGVGGVNDHTMEGVFGLSH